MVKIQAVFHSVSLQTVSSPSNSSDTTLDSSSTPPDMTHQVLVASAISHEREQLADHVVSNALERGATIAGY